MSASYPSPTTPGLQVDFRNLVIELICLNMDPKLAPRFWRGKAYWSQKYAREARGFLKFSRLHDNIDDPLFQRATIAAVKAIGCKTLLNERTLSRLDRRLKKELECLRAKREEMAAVAPAAAVPAGEYMGRNARITNLNGEGRLRRLLEIENGTKEQG